MTDKNYLDKLRKKHLDQGRRISEQDAYKVKKILDEQCNTVVSVWKPFFSDILDYMRDPIRQRIIKEVENYQVQHYCTGVESLLEKNNIIKTWNAWRHIIPIFIRFKYDGRIINNPEFVKRYDQNINCLFEDNPNRIALGIGINLEQEIEWDSPSKKHWNDPSIRIERGYSFGVGDYTDPATKKFKLEFLAEDLLGDRQGKEKDYVIINEEDLEKMVESLAPSLLHIQGLDFGPDLEASVLFLRKLLKMPILSIKKKAEKQVKEASEDYYSITERMIEFLKTQKRMKKKPTKSTWVDMRGSGGPLM